jgi:hypothetical protein
MTCSLIFHCFDDKDNWLVFSFAPGKRMHLKHLTVDGELNIFFLLELWEVESKLGPRGTAAMYWPIVPVPGDCEHCEDGEVCGMKCGWQGKPKYSEKTILSTTNST